MTLVTTSLASANLTSTANKNRFEEMIDIEMINYVSNSSDESERDQIREMLMNAPTVKKRVGILSILDNDRSAFMAIKRLIEQTNVSKTQHIKDVVGMMRDYVKVGTVEKKKFGEVMTPISLVNEMLDTLPQDVWSNPNLKWLDPANGCGVFPCVVVERLMNGLKDWEPNEELRYKHIMENMIYVCELQTKNMFLHICAFDPQDQYDLNIYCGSFLDKAFDDHMKNVWGVEKFDIVVGNPPYQKSLHVDFLEKSHELSDEVLFIHPSPWLFRGESLVSVPNNRVASIKLINGNFYFRNAEFGAPLTITYVKKPKTDTIKLIYDTTENEYIVSELPTGFWEPSKELLSLKEKFSRLSEKGNLSNILFQNLGQSYIVSSPRICGHAVNRNSKEFFFTNDFYTFFYHKSNLNDRSTTNKVFVVQSEVERKNLISYMKSKICRFALSLNKLSQDAHIKSYLSNIPIPDLKSDVNDAILCKLFNLNEEEWELIDKTIPTYYKETPFNN